MIRFFFNKRESRCCSKNRISAKVDGIGFTDIMRIGTLSLLILSFVFQVFDTFGPVKTPFYSIRLSGKIDESKISKGTRVSFVPFNQEITKYIFVEQLKK